jgi:hypothetical protein
VRSDGPCERTVLNLKPNSISSFRLSDPRDSQNSSYGVGGGGNDTLIGRSDTSIDRLTGGAGYDNR